MTLARATTKFGAEEADHGTGITDSRSAHRAGELVEEFADLAEALGESLENLAGASAFLDEVARDRQQFGDAVAPERRARATAAQLLIALLDVGGQPPVPTIRPRCTPRASGLTRGPWSDPRTEEAPGQGL